MPAEPPKEAVFSSSEDRIRAGQALVASTGLDIVSKQGAAFSIRHHLLRAAESLFTVLFPSDCRICGLPLLNISRLPVCPECLVSVEPIEGRLCSVCGERVLSAYAVYDDDGRLTCPVCRRIDRPFEQAIAFGSYDGALRELVHLLKYNGVRPAANPLGRMLAEAISKVETDFSQPAVLVVPVPLFKRKNRQRGFNQAEAIARAALKTFESPGRLQLATKVLVRTRETHSQIGLTSHQRRENLRGAFKVARAEEVTGREVLLVDDVYTTGTTATECARVLRRAGASKVWVATVARTLKLASKYQEDPGFKVSEFQSVEHHRKESANALETVNFETLKL